MSPKGGMPAGGATAAGLAANGQSCVAATDCTSGNCVGGLCCDTACGEACFACGQLLTGKPDGTCSAVGAGKKDPHDTCKDETATNQCGGDGFCDGAGACRKVGADHVCATASCNLSKFTPTSTCDGKGACKAVTSLDCGEAACDVVDGCRTACATDSDCPASSYCHPTTKRCSAKKIDGDACTQALECNAGFCADGVCCNTACDGKCVACSSSLTSQKSGVCSAVKVGTDPHDSCAVEAANVCGTDGTCDGAGACRMKGVDVVCKPASCSDGSFTRAATCNGTGTCSTATPESCGAFLCSETAGCQKTCAADADCTGKNYCDAATKACAAKKDNGAACKDTKECASGFCVDGLCCNAKCDGACTSCKKVHTNTADGTCASVGANQDPYDSCADETAANPCGKTGMCDGAGACQKADKTKSCGTATCNGNQYTPASLCDGSGTCKAGSQTNCGNFQCSTTTGCLTTCSGSADCSSATYCDLSLAKPVCVPKKANGASCGTDGSACATGKCVDGVCCESACATSCYACNVPGKLGTCAPVSTGTTDPKALCAVSNTTCGQNGKCNGSGGCYVAPAGTTGADCGNTCTGSSLTKKSCDGTGSCVGSATPCANNLVCASANACKSACTASTDCTNDMVCLSGGAGQCTSVCLFDSSSFDDGCVFGP